MKVDEKRRSNTVVEGTIRPLKNHVLVKDMNFGERRTASGLVLMSDDATERGIRPRWAKVISVGPTQDKVKEDDWVLVEHGRWTRSWDYAIDDEIKQIRMVDPKDILGCQRTEPEDSYVSDSITGNI